MFNFTGNSTKTKVRKDPDLVKSEKLQEIDDKIEATKHKIVLSKKNLKNKQDDEGILDAEIKRLEGKVDEEKEKKLVGFKEKIGQELNERKKDLEAKKKDYDAAINSLAHFGITIGGGAIGGTGGYGLAAWWWGGEVAKEAAKQAAEKVAEEVAKQAVKKVTEEVAKKTFLATLGGAATGLSLGYGGYQLYQYKKRQDAINDYDKKLKAYNDALEAYDQAQKVSIEVDGKFFAYKELKITLSTKRERQQELRREISKINTEIENLVAHEKDLENQKQQLESTIRSVNWNNSTTPRVIPVIFSQAADRVDSSSQQMASTPSGPVRQPQELRH